MAVRKKRSISLPPDLDAEIAAAAEHAGMTYSSWLAATARKEFTIRAGLAAVAQFEDEHGAFTPGELADADQWAAGQHLDSSGQDLIKRAVDGLHDGAAGVVAVLIYGEPDGEAGGNDYGSCHGPPGGIVDAARGGGSGHGNHASLVHPAAGDARVQVVFHPKGRNH